MNYTTRVITNRAKQSLILNGHECFNIKNPPQKTTEDFLDKRDDCYFISIFSIALQAL